MPVVLSQLFSPADRVYEDAEFALYHYPRVYFSRVRQYDPFVYYRPLGKSQRRADSMCYFGHGVIGEWYEDSRDGRFRFANLRGRAFRDPVPLRDAAGNFFETETEMGPQFQAAVRELSPTAYWRILAAGGETKAAVDQLPSPEDVVISPYPLPLVAAPTDAFRRIENIPAGAGYVPRGDTKLNVYESAALQERARADHQNVLRTIQREVLRRGGTTFYNNNVDLYANLEEKRFLIEAKSLNQGADAVGRMRYGIGQLADYAYRYRHELPGAQRVLAFGSPPTAENTWIGSVLDREAVAFVSTLGGRVVALNEAAQGLPFVDTIAFA